MGLKSPVNFHLYITNLPQGALQSLHHTTPPVALDKEETSRRATDVKLLPGVAKHLEREPRNLLSTMSPGKRTGYTNTQKMKLKQHASCNFLKV